MDDITKPSSTTRNLTRSTSTAQAFRSFVTGYLVTELGRDTPDSVAAALLTLDPVLFRFTSRPSTERLHRLRLVIQGVHACARRRGPQSARGRRYGAALAIVRLELDARAAQGQVSP